MNNRVFGITMENVRKNGSIKLVTCKEEVIVQCQNQNIKQQFFFFRKSICHRNEKTKIFMDKPVCLGQLILELSKTVMHEFWYDYGNQNMEKKQNCICMYTERFIIYIKTEDIYSDIAKSVKARFYTSNYALDRPLPKEKNNKITGIMKYELGRKIMKKLASLRAKT